MLIILNPLGPLAELAELGVAILAAVGLSLLIVVVAICAIIAYLAVRAHASGYVTFSVRAVGTWYVQIIQLFAVLIAAVGIASLLNVGIGAVAGAEYSFSKGTTFADYPYVVYQAVVALGGGVIVLWLHRRLETFFEPNHAAVTARRFRLTALSIVAGAATVVLLFVSGFSLVEYHVGSPSEAAGDTQPGQWLSGLAVAAVSRLVALRLIKRELRSVDQITSPNA